jgi:hypothetical protein
MCLALSSLLLDLVHKPGETSSRCFAGLLDETGHWVGIDVFVRIKISGEHHERILEIGNSDSRSIHRGASFLWYLYLFFRLTSGKSILCAFNVIVLDLV